MTPQSQRDEWRRLADAASIGPWRSDGHAHEEGDIEELAKSLDARLTPPPAEPIHQLGTLDTDRPEDDLRAEFFAYIGTDEDAATPVLTNLGNLRAIARLAAGYDVARIEEGERPDTLSRAEYVRLLGVQDLARLVLAGYDNGYPVEGDTWEADLFERLRDAVREVSV